jgi:hypothetical protein
MTFTCLDPVVGWWLCLQDGLLLPHQQPQQQADYCIAASAT